MGALLIYLLKAAIIQVLLLLCYWLLLQRDTFYRMVRYYFMGGLAVSYIIPLIRFDIGMPFTSTTTPQTANVLIVYNYLPDLSMSTLHQSGWQANYSFSDYVSAVVIIGMVIMLLRFVRQYINLNKLRIKQHIKYDTYSIVNIDAAIKPFSFGKRVYINPELHSVHELDEIIQHELIHVNQRHSIDILISSINKCLFWWNPVSWILSNIIRNNLEYIVDNEMLNKGVDRKHYQYNLLYISQLNYSNSIVNYFNLSNLKKRIKMMNKKRTQSFYKMKWLLLLPVATVILLSFNLKRLNATDRIVSNDDERLNTIINSDTITVSSLKDVTIGVGEKNNKTSKDKQDSFRIGGITKENAPLIMVDGVETSYEDFQSKVNKIEKSGSESIKAIHILKAQTAIELYGEKAKNGVMLVYIKQKPPKDIEHQTFINLKQSQQNGKETHILGEFEINNKFAYVDGKKVPFDSISPDDNDRVEIISDANDSLKATMYIYTKKEGK